MTNLCVRATQKRFTENNGEHSFLATQTLAVIQDQPHQLDL